MTLRRHRALGCLLRIAWLAGAALLVLALVGYVSTEQLQAFGSAPAGETPARIRASPEFHGDHLALLATPPASGYASHGLGHSGPLIELDGARILTDPQWSERASPTQLCSGCCGVDLAAYDSVRSWQPPGATGVVLQLGRKPYFSITRFMSSGAASLPLCATSAISWK